MKQSDLLRKHSTEFCFHYLPQLYVEQHLFLTFHLLSLWNISFPSQFYRRKHITERLNRVVGISSLLSRGLGDRQP